VIAESLHAVPRRPRFAQILCPLHAGRGQGPVRIAADLRRLGLPEGLVDAALGVDRIGPRSRAVCALQIRRQAPRRSWADKARQARFLQYRGFFVGSYPRGHRRQIRILD